MTDPDLKSKLLDMDSFRKTDKHGTASFYDRNRSATPKDSDY
jgi:hypothetical protein